MWCIQLARMFTGVCLAQISCVIPCLEMAWDSGIDPQAPQVMLSIAERLRLALWQGYPHRKLTI